MGGMTAPRKSPTTRSQRQAVLIVLLAGMSGALLAGIGAWYFTPQNQIEIAVVGLLSGMLLGWPAAAICQRGE